MWGSLGVGNHTSIIDMGDELQTIIASTLVEHPLIKSNPNNAIRIAKDAITLDRDVSFVRPSFPKTGEGWFESQLGKTAEELIGDLRKAEDLQGVSDLIKSIEHVHLQETQATLDSMEWADIHHDTIIQLGLDERTLKSLRIYGELKKNTLRRACLQWENADSVLKSLDQFHDVWGEEETNAWETAMQSKQDAKEIWKSALNQFNTLSKEQQNWLSLAKAELVDAGPLTARAITERLIEKGTNRLNVNRMAKLLKMYGEEIAILKGHKKGEYIAAQNGNIIIKDIWHYAGGFIDEHGAFSITDRDEPRLTIVTKGERGRLHCTQLHDNLGFGALQLNKSVSVNEPNAHQLEFRGQDVAKLLSGSLPYIENKSKVAKAMAHYFLEPDNLLMKQYVQYQSWNGTHKAEKALRQWGVDQDTVLSWAEEL
jgi:hypothetical protein